MKLGIALAGLLLSATTAQAAGTDCPLAHQPYSSRTILADVLGDPAAKAVLDREAPELVSGFSRNFGGRPLPPGFARILSLESLLRTRPNGAALASRLDTALGAVKLTPQAIRARCAGYDQTPPGLPANIKRPAILVFDKITGFRDAPSVNAATAALKAMAARRGWTIVFSDNGAVFNARDLARFDAVVWNNVSGDALTVRQEQALKSWLAHGGGFAGFHGSGGDPLYVWDWYADTLIGARFIGHPMSPQFQAARVIVEDSGSAITRGLGPGWTMTEEWYSFAASPRSKGAHILARLDESSYSPLGIGGQDLRMGDHPIAWTQCIGNGRSFYSAIGHRPENYSEPNSLKLLENGIAWAAGLGETRCLAGKESGTR
ncbi:ThuA domain-containing protein [Sphingomonas tabacisoli]|uniref:ThuA domain-containing protein n=1 Tax=Sphingomonas tabacisoli TaxID=2249466 RepID=A0ABW4I4V4_9SPHN